MRLSAQSIRARGIFSPFHERTKSHGMTYGLGPAGYDVRIAENMIIWPKCFRLASTIEHFNVPSDLTFDVKDKSTWARRGLQAFNTTGEPAWHGHLTLELVNHSWLPIRLKRGMPIAQIALVYLDAPTEIPYDGKYQGQKAGPCPAKFERA